MERRYEVRKREIEEDAELDSKALAGAMARLGRFARSFLESLGRKENRENGLIMLKGLMSDLKRKNVESIAYRHGKDRRGLQRFVGQGAWEDAPLVEELSGQVGRKLGEADGVIIFDPSGFEKCGDRSVGTGRQWLGRFGKVDNGQVGVYLAYATRKEYALCNARLFLPEDWAEDAERRQKAGVPEDVEFKTRHQLCLEMLDQSGPHLPHQWIAGDDELGRPTWFRRELRRRGEGYVLAVPSNTSVRDLERTPAYSGHGRPPKGPFESVCVWAERLTPEQWTSIDVRDGEKGPQVLRLATCRVLARTERGKRGSGQEELLIVTRRRAGSGWRYDYYLSNAEPDTPLAELARVVDAEHRVEDCFRRAKSEAGMADYEVRTWAGWHHHMTLSMLAAWFLTLETLRGKKIAPGAYSAHGPIAARNHAA